MPLPKLVVDYIYFANARDKHNKKLRAIKRRRILDMIDLINQGETDTRELARLLGVTVRTIQRYKKIDLPTLGICECCGQRMFFPDTDDNK